MKQNINAKYDCDEQCPACEEIGKVIVIDKNISIVGTVNFPYTNELMGMVACTPLYKCQKCNKEYCVINDLSIVFKCVKNCFHRNCSDDLCSKCIIECKLNPSLKDTDQDGLYVKYRCHHKGCRRSTSKKKKEWVTIKNNRRMKHYCPKHGQIILTLIQEKENG